jgi:signal transduction histidine kinase
MRGQGTRSDAPYSGRIAIGLIAVLGVTLLLVGSTYKRTGRGAAGVELALMSRARTVRLATDLERTLTESGRMGAGTQLFLSQAAAELDASLELFFEADTPLAVAHGPSLREALGRIRKTDAHGTFTDSGQQPWVPSFGDRIDDPRFARAQGRPVRVQRDYPWAVEAPVGANMTLRQIPLSVQPTGDGGFLSGLVVLFIVMSLASVIIALRLARPLESTAAAFERLASGDLLTRIPATGIRELSGIGRGSMRIAERIRDADVRQREMLVRVGSLLVEPVNSARSRLSGLDRAAVPPAPRRALESVDSDIHRLHRTVTSLWRWHELEEGEAESSPTEIDIRPTFSEVVDLFVQRRAPDLVVELEFDDDVDESLEMDGRLMAGVLAALLDNARTHGAGPVAIHVSRSHTKVEVAVQDQGPGVPFEQLSSIFEPFQTARTEHTDEAIGGLGLGLRIARLVLRLHRGGLTARNVPAGGFEVCFWLPAPPIRVSRIDKSLLESVDWINKGEDERLEVGDPAPADEPVESPAEPTSVAGPEPAPEPTAPPADDDFEP